MKVKHKLLSIAFSGVRITIETVTKQYCRLTHGEFPKYDDANFLQVCVTSRPLSLSLSSNRCIFSLCLVWPLAKACQSTSLPVQRRRNNSKTMMEPRSKRSEAILSSLGILVNTSVYFASGGSNIPPEMVVNDVFSDFTAFCGPIAKHISWWIFDYYEIICWAILTTTYQEIPEICFGRRSSHNTAFIAREESTKLSKVELQQVAQPSSLSPLEHEFHSWHERLQHLSVVDMGKLRLIQVGHVPSK